MADERAYCNIHERHCVMIEDLRTDGVVLRNEMKDMRSSHKTDLEKRDAAMCLKYATKTEISHFKSDDYITKKEFSRLERIFYTFIALVLAQIVKGYFG